ncbi:MAG: hypothetical protein KDB69_05560 [Acidimicrobiia bacterium]|nr:hypothetical protein [Acidimicrobiia bacterium]
MNAPLFFAAMMGLVLLFGVLMFWQESKRMRHREAIYGVEDSIVWVWESLGEDKLGLTKGDVRRILEWELHYLQQPHLWKDEGNAVVGSEASAAYVQQRALDTGHPYEPGQIFAVLDHQATYLEAIGAVAAPVISDDDAASGST